MFELNGWKQQWWWGCVIWHHIVMTILCLMQTCTPNLYWHPLMSYRSPKGSRLMCATTSSDFLFLCLLSLVIRLYSALSLTLVRSGRSVCLPLSLKAIHIQHNNPYKHLFLFMSLSSAHQSSTHPNVNTETVLPWGRVTHHTCEQKTHPYLPGSAFVRASLCHPRTHYYSHSHFCHLE